MRFGFFYDMIGSFCGEKIKSHHIRARLVQGSFLVSIYPVRGQQVIFLPAELEKSLVFTVIFLENSKNLVIFTKSSNKFGEFLRFLGFCKIVTHFLVFSYAFLIFLIFLECSRKYKKIKKT